MLPVQSQQLQEDTAYWWLLTWAVSSGSGQTQCTLLYVLHNVASPPHYVCYNIPGRFHLGMDMPTLMFRYGHAMFGPVCSSQGS